MSRKHPPQAKTLMVLALFSLLAACGSSDKDDDDHSHAHNHGGRLIYSLSTAPGLSMHDQTLETPEFVNTNVNSLAGAQLTLSKDGLTAALQEGTNLSVVSSGLEHLQGDHAHTHDVGLTGGTFTNVQQVVATGHYFSTLSGNNSDLISSNGESVEKSWSNVVYPTLALKGGDFLKFTANAVNNTVTNISVVDHHGSTGVDGRIFVRPNNEGYFTESITCTGGISETAQTDNFTVILCGDGTLRWLISGYLAPEGHPAAGQTLHVTQRYPATDNRRAGAIGEVTAGSSGFIEGISGLTTTHHEDNVIAAWSSDQLWLINAHNDHPHRGDLSGITGVDFGNIIAVATTTDDNALAALSDSGKVAISRFEVNSSSNPVTKGEVVREQLGTAANWAVTDNSILVPGSYAFFVINKITGTLYNLDAHAADDDYHLHGSYQDDSLRNLSSAVFAHAIEDDHDDHHHDH
jgi:hypothetical protein